MRLDADQWADASCRQYDPELWWSTKPGEMQQAIAICKECPLIDACPEIGQHERWGIWAGVDRAAALPATPFVRKEAGDPCAKGHTDTYVSYAGIGRRFRCRTCREEGKQRKETREAAA